MVAAAAAVSEVPSEVALGTPLEEVAAVTSTVVG
tara:strand:+ start:284 stop:385 length:102 start_codon:yes stop_codon:yes gene_type:complete